MGLRFDAEQRFTCRQCGRCCRRGWDIVVTPGEVEAYRRARAERWYREAEDAAEAVARDPFEPIPGLGHLRIRKRPDGACGFLSKENRCRIHEELGAQSKPLTCRLFPFRFHPADGTPLVTASFCCPTVTANDGAPLADQAKELSRLQREWSRTYPEPERGVLFAPGRAIGAATLDTLRSILREMLDRPGPGGAPDLRANAGRMARTLEDLSRHRVVTLEPQAFAEYLELTGRYAARDEKPFVPRPPSRVARVLFRGFLYAVVAARMQLEDRRSSGLRLSLRWRLARLLAHFHGLAPPVAGVELAAARRAPVDLADPAARDIAYNYLRVSIETLGTGRRPVVEEIGLAVAFLDAGCVLAAMRAARAGRTSVDGATLAEGLMDAVDLTHAESSGVFGSMLGTLSGGVEALYLFAAGARV